MKLAVLQSAALEAEDAKIKQKATVCVNLTQIS